MNYPYIIRNSAGYGKNLLIFGDSFNLSNLEPLSSHFNTTVFFERRIAFKIPIDYIIDKYKIDALLICGYFRFLNDKKFLFTFEGAK
ncbi:MAG: hypothetical protein IJ597_01415, partial [Synergistaceae bacterium]|nr:hypothetical protein [Synergistaceae bacterium]